RRDLMLSEQVRNGRSAERRTVVALDYQGRAAVREQRGQGVRRGFGGGGFDRLPEQLQAAGQVADGEEIREAAVDGRRRLGKVDGPDAAGIVPVQDAERFAMALSPDAAIAADQVLEGAIHTRSTGH